MRLVDSRVIHPGMERRDPKAALKVGALPPHAVPEDERIWLPFINDWAKASEAHPG
jgi:hypothetical protein